MHCCISLFYCYYHERSEEIKDVAISTRNEEKSFASSKTASMLYKISLSLYPHSHPCSLEMTTFFRFLLLPNTFTVITSFILF